MEKEELIGEFTVRVKESADGTEMCYVTKNGENMCFEMSMCEFEKWIFYRRGIHVRPKKLDGSVGFLIRDITPPEQLIGFVREFITENPNRLGESA